MGRKSKHFGKEEICPNQNWGNLGVYCVGILPPTASAAEEQGTNPPPFPPPPPPHPPPPPPPKERSKSLPLSVSALSLLLLLLSPQFPKRASPGPPPPPLPPKGGAEGRKALFQAAVVVVQLYKEERSCHTEQAALSFIYVLFLLRKTSYGKKIGA